MAPSASLPDGLLERVLTVGHQATGTTLTLAPVPFYDVVPVAQFDVPLTVRAAPAGAARAPRLVSGQCAPSSPVYRRIANIRFAGGWNTLDVLGVHVTDGVRVQVDFDAHAGISDLQGLSIDTSCELDVSGRRRDAVIADADLDAHPDAR
jgi:hypothetical protein